MNKAIRVVAVAIALPGKSKEAEALLTSVVAPTRKEAGCRQYDLHRRKDQPGTFYFIEEWDSQDTLNRHLSSAHIQEAMREKDSCLASLDIALLDQV